MRPTFPTKCLHTHWMVKHCICNSYLLFSSPFFYQWTAKGNDRSVFKPTALISLHFLEVQFGNDALNITYTLTLYKATNRWLSRDLGVLILFGFFFFKEKKLKCKKFYAQRCFFHCYMQWQRSKNSFQYCPKLNGLFNPYLYSKISR